MENWWMNKCNSTLPSMASSSSQELRNQMEMSAGYISCRPGSQDIRPSMLGRLQDPLFPNLQSSGSHRSEHVNLGNPFLSLLSGSPSLFQHDFQHFSNPKPIGTSGKLLPESNNSILNGTQSAIQLLSSRILPEKLSGKVLQSGTGFCPNGSLKVVASSSCASNSVLHDLQSSDLTNVVICQMVPGNGKVKSPFSSSGEWHSTIPADMGKAYRANILTAQKMPVEANSFTSNQSSGVWHNASHADTGNVCRGNTQTSQKVPEEAHSFISNQASSLWHSANSADNGRACRDNVQNSQKIPMEANSSIPSQASGSVNGCPRVFCSTTSGYLLVSNTGLIGILCSCHTSHMSAYKFCEHSGLYGVNPGDTIYMDSGETIAQWCRLYLLKFGIRVPGDKSEWDWPEELSANAGLMKSSVPMPNISNSLSGCSSSSKQYFDGFSSKSQSLFIGAVSNKLQRNTEDTNNIFLKALTGSSPSNLHIVADNLIMEHAMPTAKVVHNRIQDGCQSISAYNGSMQNGTFSITRPSLQGQRVVGKESNFCRIENTKDGAFRDSAISNIELKLGQPYQLAQTSGNPDISTAGPQLRCTDANPMKSLFPQQMVPNTANCREEVAFRQCLHFAADPSNPGAKGDRNQLNCGNNAFVISNATYDTRVERHSNNLAQDLLLTNLRSPPKEATRSKANNHMFNDSGHTLRNMLHSEPQPAKYDPSNVPQSRSNCESQLDMSELGLSSSFNRLSGNYESHFLTAHKNSCYSHQLSAVPPGTPDSRKCSNYPEKVISFGNYGQVDHVYHRPLPSSMGSGLILSKQAVSKGTTLSASTSLSGHLTPPYCREEFTGVRIHFPDDKLQVPSQRQMQEISKKRHVLPSLSKNQGEGRVGCSSYMQHSLGDNSASEVQKLGLTSKHIVSEATCKPHQSGVTCRIGSDEGFASMTGVNCCCHISRYEQGNELNFNENSIVPLSNGHPSPRSGKSVTEPREDERFCHKVPYGYVHGSSSCAVHRNCLERNHEWSVCSSPNAHKEQLGTVNGEASVIYSPQFANNHIVAKDKTIPSDPKRKLSELPKNSADHTSQWRDVPSKVKGLSDVTRVDRLANLFDATRQDREKLGDTCIRCFNGTLKEHEISNISSGCSAPAVSQASCEVNNMDSSTNDAMDNGHASDLVIDEGSGIDKAWSSDDARESEKNTEFVASTGSSQRKVGSPENLNHQSSFSLLNELKLLNSLTWQKGRNQNPGGLASHEKDKHLQNLETGKRKRGLVSEILNDSSLTSDPSRAPQETSKGNCISQSPNCPSKRLKIPLPSRQSETHTIGPCVTESKSKPRLHISAKKLLRKRDMRRLHNKDRDVNSVHQIELNHGTNNCEIVEVSGGKKFKRDCSSNYISQFQIQESSYDDAKKAKHNSTDTLKSSSIQQVINGHRNARPIVCGKYGELADESSTGEMSKPAKVVPLSRVLKSARKCTVPIICKPKSTSLRQLKRRSIGGNISCNTFSDLKTEKKFDSNLFLLEKQGDDRTEKDHCKLDNHTQLQLKPKEIRKRSIYELTGKGEDPSFENSSVSKISNCLPAMKDGKLVNTGEESGLCKHIAKKCPRLIDSDASCCVCGNSNKDEINKLLECSQCSIKVHQACYGVSRVPKARWCCRPCRTSSKDTVCVLCGYGGGAMTQALGSQTIVKSILRAWNTEKDVSENSSCVSKIKEHNSITVGLLDLKTKQWIHMVCGLWTPETRCPNVDTMSAFDVSGVPLPGPDVVCCLCKRAGGSCIQCRVVNCSVRFHPWCAHQKGLLQTEIEGVDNESVGFYGRCALHATQPMYEADNDPIDTDTTCLEKGKLTCARSEGYKGRIRDGFRHNYCGRAKGNSGCLVRQEQLIAWEYLNGHKLCTKELSQLAISDVEHDSRKEYARYRQAKSWKHLVVYKSGIHALGLYTSRFISRDEMVVEYVGEIVGQRVADKREIEYQSGKKLQYKSACYFFRIDKDHIIDATCKGGIARFVNHSCSPNCIAKVISVRNEKKVVFLAERDIFPGEEITYDYHFNHEDEGKKIPCFCNSKNCRRYLN